PGPATGPVAVGKVYDPTAVTVASSGDVYVLERYSNSVNRVQRFDALGNYVTSWGAYGTGNGQFVHPKGIAVDSLGNVYVADTGNGRIQRFSSAGVAEVEWGQYPGSGVPDLPTGIAVDASDNVYVTKKATDQIQKFDAAGNLLAEFGGTGNTNGKLNDPGALAIGPLGDLYVADTTNQRIQKLDSSGGYITQWGSSGTGNGQVSNPSGIAVNPSSGSRRRVRSSRRSAAPRPVSTRASSACRWGSRSTPRAASW